MTVNTGSYRTRPEHIQRLTLYIFTYTVAIEQKISSGYRQIKIYYGSILTSKIMPMNQSLCHHQLFVLSLFVIICYVNLLTNVIARKNHSTMRVAFTFSV